jgi:hypothetical protein
MSDRYEFIDARHTPIEVAEPHESVGLDRIDPGNHALIIGESGATALVVEGSPAHLREFAQRVATAVAGIPSEAPDDSPSPSR